VDAKAADGPSKAVDAKRRWTSDAVSAERGAAKLVPSAVRVAACAPPS
jgi:hypothetical protein